MDTVADEVVVELLKSGLPLEAQACMGAISAGELSAWMRPWSPFRCLFGFVEWTGDLSAFPAWPGQIVQTKDGPRTTHAAGAWQDQPATWDDVVAANPGIQFDAQGQIAGNWWLAQRDYRARTQLSLLSDLGFGTPQSLARVQSGLFGTWPGGADDDFPQVYAATMAILQAQEPSPPLPPNPPPPIPPTDPLVVALAALQVEHDKALAELDARQATIDSLKAEIDSLKSAGTDTIVASFQMEITAFAAALLRRGIP